jgi:SAM-dependent methyltransferase
MEYTSCLTCGSEEFKVVLEGPDRLCGLPGIFRLVQCTRCQLIYQNPRPAEKDISQYYKGDYLPFLPAIEDETSFIKRLDRWYGLWKRCHLVNSFFPRPGKILDIGCATGIFLNGMKTKGWEVLGVELSAKAADYAQKRFRLPVQCLPIQSFQAEPGSMDVITMWDVLEHVHDPKQLLRLTHTWLKPGGRLLLTLPNPESWELGFFRQYWIGWDLPRHLCLFPEQTLRQMLISSGFRVTNFFSFTGRYHTFLLSLELLLKDKRPNSRWNTMGIRLLKWWPFRFMGLTIFSLLDRIHLSSIVAVVAVKEENIEKI